jgi:HD-like signal output (HDOD) protein
MHPSDDAAPHAVAAPSRTGPEAALAHPFIRRLFEFGRSRLAVPVPEPAVVRPASRLRSLAPASGTPLAEINPPPLPQVFLSLRRAVDDPMSTMADVARVVSTDPSLTTYVLRLANSALYGRQVKVETVERAVGCIGLSEIETMALGAVMGQVFKDPPRPELLSMAEFWRHAVSVGLLAGALAERVEAGGKDRFFAAGLVHDMGRLLLAIAEPDLAALALARAGETGDSLDAAERGILGFDHAVLAGRVCWKWQLPDSLGEAVAWHHDPSQCPDNALATVVHAADFMANALGIRARPTGALPELDPTALSGLGLDEADPAPLLDALEAGLDALTSLFTACATDRPRACQGPAPGVTTA